MVCTLISVEVSVTVWVTSSGEFTVVDIGEGTIVKGVSLIVVTIEDG